MALTQTEVDLIVEQIKLSIAQQTAEQVAQAIQQTGGSLAADKKALGYTDVTEDTQTDEAFRGKTFTDAEMWGINKKFLVEREQSSAQKSHDFDKSHKEIELAAAKIELARKQSDFNVTEQLRAIAVSEAQQAATIKHMLNLEYAKFNAAVSEPINPNTGITRMASTKRTK